MNRFFSHLPAWVDCVGLGHFAGEREEHGDRMLGGRDRIAERRIHDDDAARGRRRHIDRVDADAGPADHLQARQCGIEDWRGHPGRAPHREPVIVADDRREFVGGQAGIFVDGDAALAEDRRRARVHRVRN